MARSPALRAAISTESTRLICPAPTPTVARPEASTIALRLTRAATVQANSRSAHSASVGSRLVTTLNSAGSSPGASRSCTSAPPATGRSSRSCPAGGGASTRRRLPFAAKTSSASVENPGGHDHFREHIRDRPGRLGVHDVGEPDHAAVGRHGIRRVRGAVRRAEIIRLRRAARVVVLDDRHRRRGQVRGEQPARPRRPASCCRTSPCPGGRARPVTSPSARSRRYRAPR